MEERLKTISKVFYDDEILFKDPDNGDLHLKPGVKRRHYGDDINPDELESHINNLELVFRKIESIHKKQEEGNRGED